MASTYLLSPPPSMSHSTVKATNTTSATQAANFKKNHRPRTTTAVVSLSKKWILSSSLGAGGTVADLPDQEGNNWNLCRQALSSLNFDTEEVDKILGKAFGHIHSPFWGEDRPKQVPKYESVNSILNYLRSLALDDEDLAKILKKFPEVLGCSLEEVVEKNVMVLEMEWGITGNSLRNLLLRNPKVLGYNVDCKGSCLAQCTRCWVRF